MYINISVLLSLTSTSSDLWRRPCTQLYSLHVVSFDTIITRQQYANVATGRASVGATFKCKLHKSQLT